MSVTRSSNWQIHLPAGVEPAELDLLAAGGLPATWRRRASEDPADPALLCYTSGTTGAPKGAVLAHGNLLASAEALLLAWRWTDGDRLVLALPLFHIHGLGAGLHGTLLAGASAVLLPRFDVDAVLDAARDHQATLFFGVPTMYARLADSPRAGELARLRLCVSGSAPLPLTVFQRLAGGDQGEVLLRGPNVFGGYNVHPREVEELLLEHPGVAEAAVVGAPSEEWGEQVAAFVVPTDPAAPPDRDELLAFAAERLAGFKRPRILRYVEALPRNALGKDQKYELRP